MFHLGGLGLLPLGLLDNSPLPTPGAMDVATILLSARQQQLWLYYALMATVGSLIGGFVTYRLARKGGKAALERRFSRRKVDKVCEIFQRWGFGAIVIPALLPPPVPMVPFLLAAGYGHRIIAFIRVHGHPVALGIIIVLLASAAVIFYFWGGARSKRGRGN